MMSEWWEEFFDLDYLKLWRHFNPEERCDREVEGLWELLKLAPGSSVLDAPCGYGRLSLRLARKGATVLGVDQSEALLNWAETQATKTPGLKLRYRQQDLRRRIPDESETFDCAINIFSSLGYGSEEDDLEILRSLRVAVRPGGLVFVETNHRDAAVAFLSRNDRPAARLADGTLIVEEPRLDQISGRVETRWYWAGPDGHGTKEASFRVYTATEMVALVKRADLEFVSAHAGCSPEPFKFTQERMGGRVGILARRT